MSQKLKTILLILSAPIFLAGCMNSQTVFVINGDGLVEREEFSISGSNLGWDAITPEDEIQVNILGVNGVEIGETELKSPTGFEFFQKTIADEFFAKINPNIKNGFSKSDCSYNSTIDVYYMFCATETTPYPITDLFEGEVTKESFEIEEIGRTVEGIKIVGTLAGDYALQFALLQEYSDKTYPEKSTFIEAAEMLHAHEDGETHSHNINPNPSSVITVAFPEGYIHNVEGEGIISLGFDFFEIDLTQYDGSEISITGVFNYAEALEQSTSTASSMVENSNNTSLIIILIAVIILLIGLVIFLIKQRKIDVNE